mgnify:CR=1 FL=1
MDNVEIVKVTEIDEAIVRLRSDGIVHVHYKEHTEITVDLQIKMYEIFIQMCGDVKRPFLFTAEDYVTVGKEARDNAIKMEDRYVGAATAVVANTVAYKLIANFYVKVNKPKNPFRVFNTEAAAIKWLKNHFKN